MSSEKITDLLCAAVPAALSAGLACRNPASGLPQQNRKRWSLQKETLHRFAAWSVSILCRCARLCVYARNSSTSVLPIRAGDGAT
jgi:hypothetical protein